MDDYLRSAMQLLTNDWQKLHDLKKHYPFIVWDTLWQWGHADMKIESLGKFKGCRHYFRIA